MTCPRHGGAAGYTFCKFCDAEVIRKLENVIKNPLKGDRVRVLGVMTGTVAKVISHWSGLYVVVDLDDPFEGDMSVTTKVICVERL